MPSTFTIKDLLPDEKYQFQLQKVIGENELSTNIVFRTPRYPKRMDFVPLKYSFGKPYTVRQDVNTSSSYIATGMVVKQKLANGTSNIRLFLANNSAKNNLLKDDNILFATQNNANNVLRYFNNSSAKILDATFVNNQNYIDIIGMTSSVFNPSGSSVVGSRQTFTGSANAVVDSTKYINVIPITIELQNGNRFLNDLMWNSLVQDIIIFSYASVTTENISTSNRYLIGNNQLVNWKGRDSKPPSYSTAVNLFTSGGTSDCSRPKIRIIHRQMKTPSIDKGNIYFWATVARYKYDIYDESWSGNWIQFDNNGNVIWTKVADKNDK